MTRMLPPLIAITLLCGCSETSGIPQVDRARDRVAAEIGTTPAMRQVGAAADRSARRAAAAGATGDVSRMADAVGRGTVDVVCAGANARSDASGVIVGGAVRSVGGDVVADAGKVVMDQAKSVVATACP